MRLQSCAIFFSFIFLDFREEIIPNFPPWCGRPWQGQFGLLLLVLINTPCKFEFNILNITFLEKD